jgi:hypothetical protein
MIEDKAFGQHIVKGLPPELKHQRAIAEALRRHVSQTPEGTDIIDRAMRDEKP